jgi:hypothetical protein
MGRFAWSNRHTDDPRRACREARGGLRPNSGLRIATQVDPVHVGSRLLARDRGRSRDRRDFVARWRAPPIRKIQL